ncbi:unnamed protein product [Oreochromis niloticus]|nr:unnamed protein product [Mustela putorius furo]
MEPHPNGRECFIRSKHLNIDDLKEEAADLQNDYLNNTKTSEYPKPEFYVSHLKHDTGPKALREIKDEGLKDPSNNDSLSLVWWSLAVRPEEIQSAERRLLEETFPNRTKEQAQRQQSFLLKFASSPAFSEKSRYGSYRFTFTVNEVLEAYRQQICNDMQPVMRVFKTSLYKKEVMYVVLVHSPNDNNNKIFEQYPILPDEPNPICAYKDGCFIWRPQAMCGEKRYTYKKDEVNNLAEVEGPFEKPYCVWDHVVLALHMKSGQKLKFNSDDLRKNLSFCECDAVTVKRLKIAEDCFINYEEAQELVTSLWPLKKEGEEKDSPMQSMAGLTLLERKRPRDD